MFTRPAQSTRSLVGKDLTERQQLGVERNDPPAGAPPGRIVALLGLATLLLLGGCGSGGASAEVTCTNGQCRAVVTGTPVEVSESTTSSGSMALVMGTSTARPKPSSSSKPSTSKPRPTTRPTHRAGSSDGRDEVDFLVRAVGPGWVEIDENGVQRVPVGEVFAEDDTLVRVEAADGGTATFTWQR
ncbi:hypothetical protein [Actinomycetospora atypica]|uniref:Lipoprotein n=1 Tax=Actinomycetospora atypica TaxID=1290095 RepID=A0ABV9YM86_9PSEU